MCEPGKRKAGDAACGAIRRYGRDKAWEKDEKGNEKESTERTLNGYIAKGERKMNERTNERGAAAVSVSGEVTEEAKKKQADLLESYRHLLTVHSQMRQHMNEQQSAIACLRACRREGQEEMLRQAVSRREEMARRYCELDGEIVRRLSEIEEALARLPAREQVMLRLRYLDGLAIDTICRKMGYSRRQIDRIRDSALRIMAGQEQWPA